MLLLLFFERKCYVITILVFSVISICYVISIYWNNVKKGKHKHCYWLPNAPTDLGQRLPSQSRLITYRIACESQMLDNEEPNVINTCASAIIEVWSRQIELSEGEVGQRLGALRLAGRRTRSRQPRRDAPRSPKWLERRGIAEPCEPIGWGSPWRDLPTSWYHPCAQIRYITHIRRHAIEATH